MVSSPAAETVETKRPLPRSSHSGSSACAARTWAITLTSQDRAQSSSRSGPPGSPAVAADPGVGAPDVDGPAERVPGLTDDRGGITRHGEAADLLGDRLGAAGVQVVDHDPRPLRGETAGQRRSDAAPGTRDDHLRTLHGLHHRSPPTRLANA